MAEIANCNNSKRLCVVGDLFPFNLSNKREQIGSIGGLLNEAKHIIFDMDETLVKINYENILLVLLSSPCSWAEPSYLCDCLRLCCGNRLWQKVRLVE